MADQADKLLKQPPVRWAIEQLRDRLKAQNVSTELHAGLGSVSPDAVTVWSPVPVSVSAELVRPSIARKRRSSAAGMWIFRPFGVVSE